MTNSMRKKRGEPMRMQANAWKSIVGLFQLRRPELKIVSLETAWLEITGEIDRLYRNEQHPSSSQVNTVPVSTGWTKERDDNVQVLGLLIARERGLIGDASHLLSEVQIMAALNFAVFQLSSLPENFRIKSDSLTREPPAQLLADTRSCESVWARLWRAVTQPRPRASFKSVVDTRNVAPDQFSAFHKLYREYQDQLYAKGDKS